MSQVKTLLFSRYREARDGLNPVHDWSLKSWSIEAARRLSLDKFIAGRTIFLLHPSY